MISCLATALIVLSTLAGAARADHQGSKYSVAGERGRSYGISIARLAGMPREVLDRAEHMLGELEGRQLGGEGQPVLVDSRRNGRSLQAG